ncbi:MAG: hypothetical protein LBT62_05570 [Deltaproteobacteria bacterium]|nr:hypothetical protein [Deltaproteobacteria bacterium]
MFWKMLKGALLRQKRKHIMIAFTVGLGVSLATAMLGVMFDVGDKVNQELKSYGANLNIIPKGASMFGDMYRVEESLQDSVQDSARDSTRNSTRNSAQDDDDAGERQGHAGQAQDSHEYGHEHGQSDGQSLGDQADSGASQIDQVSLDDQDSKIDQVSLTDQDGQIDQASQINQDSLADQASPIDQDSLADQDGQIDQIDGQADLANNYILEDELYKIKMIFWAYNIVDFAPYLTIPVKVNGETVSLTGTWFNKHLSLPTGDEVDTGMTALKSWWVLEGAPGDDGDETSVLVGQELADDLDLKVGDGFTLTAPGGKNVEVAVRAIFESGSEDESGIFAPIALAQRLSSKPGLVQRAEVSALTTPDNDLSRRAAQNPGSLTRVEWDTWYCTAYISSIAYQIEEILPGVRVKPMLRVSQSEGAILSKTQLMIILLTILTLLCSALAISNLVTANIMERSVEIGLLKALGATGLAIVMLVLCEISAAAFVGGIAGYLTGLGLAQFIGLSVFGATVSVKAVVIPIGVLMVLVVTLLGSLPALKALLRLKPTEVLHG